MAYEQTGSMGLNISKIFPMATKSVIGSGAPRAQQTSAGMFGSPYVLPALAVGGGLALWYFFIRKG